LSLIFEVVISNRSILSKFTIHKYHVVMPAKYYVLDMTN